MLRRVPPSHASGMTTSEQSAPFVAGQGGGRAFWHIDSLKIFKALSETTGGRLAAWEELLPQRSSPPLHVHHDADEAWFVLDGAITFRVQDDEFGAESGSFVWGPRGLPHSFRVDSPTARLLGLALPGGFDRFVRATGRPAEALTLPPAPDGPPDMGPLVAAARAHGIEVLGPPMA
jgi:mannose-6-phosphate isomerase-like protein (cupin superfamily)